MKNALTFAAFFFLFVVNSFAQKGQPIQPYNENGYKKVDIKKFALDSTLVLSSNFRKELVKIVNEALVATGESLVVTEANISWIINNTVDSTVTLSDFTNSGRVGNSIKFFQDQDFTGMVKVFVYGNCRVILMKTICMNLLKVPAEKITQVKAPAAKKLVQKTPTRTISGNTTIINDTIINRTVTVISDVKYVDTHTVFYPYSYVSAPVGPGPDPIARGGDGWTEPQNQFKQHPVGNYSCRDGFHFELGAGGIYVKVKWHSGHKCHH
ncbi:MAG: hypothetical protein AAB438_03085 [Patescibacteria group bacterium]